LVDARRARRTRATAVATQVGITQVVREDENEIRLLMSHLRLF
jgi:hypothetical protein